MQKTATLNIRINQEVKNSAEKVLSRLGVPMATAIDIYLKQIAYTGGIPFAITLPKAPDRINMDKMSPSEIRDKLDEGFADIASGRVHSAREVFTQFREGRSHETI